KILLKKQHLAHVIVATHVQHFHRNIDLDINQIWDTYSFINLKKSDIDTACRVYRRLCLHCQRKPHVFRYPINKTITGSKPRAVLHMDYLYVNSHGAILSIVDNFSRKTYLEYVTNESAEVAATALLNWHSNFVLDQYFTLVTDRGSHFAITLFTELIPKLRGNHEFSITHASWTHGSVENQNSVILKYIRQIRSELNLTSSEWPNYLSLVTSIINNIPIRSRA